MAAVAIAVVGGVWYGARAPEPVPIEVGDPTGSIASIGLEAAEAPEPGIVTVHVAGAVRRPGLVSVSVPARVADVVAAAGGAEAFADLGAMNLAAPVGDGDRVEVPVLGAAPGSSEPDVGEGGVDLNRATANELQALPGVGPVIAARIAAHREENGPFATIEDLLDVPGIGETKLAELRAAVRIP
ncbi:MAG: helix-hairpin-helix domain-containing protein [Actinomycetota bacterium]|nr:helix-hairpin-helix domain-containing protein [Actinomycetota bacterium]